MKIDKTRILVTLSLAVCLLLLGTPLTHTGQRGLNLKTLPKTVQKTIKQQSQGGSIRVIWKESRGGKTYYGVAMKVNGQRKEIVVDAEGRLVTSEDAVKLAALPEAVQKVVQEQSKGGTLKGVSQEIEGEKINYEAAVQVNGQQKEILIDPMGNVLEVEEKLTLDSLPPAVKAAIEKHAGKAKVLWIESITKGKDVVYEAVLETEGRRSEIKVTADGRLIKGSGSASISNGNAAPARVA